MRQPLLSKTGRRARVSEMKSYPSPVEGWNARDSLAAMKPLDAVTLDNWFPTPSNVTMRGGYASHATGTTGNVKTLAVYNKLAGTSNMYAYTSSGIYDVSSAGAVGASKLSRTNGKHQWTMFGDGTYNWLIAVNGVDKPAYYDGTTWTAVDGATSPALTGVTTTNLIGVFVFKGRLIFIEKSTLAFWYLAAGAAGGALTKFDLSGEAPAGGYLMACGSWTRDGGTGPDDFFVAITSEGEVIVYQGTNPSSATTWAKVGTYKIAKPLGRRCMIQYGSDCLIVTENGVFPMSAVLTTTDEQARFALSFKIQSVFSQSARNYGSIFGWEAINYLSREALLVNVPIAEDGEHEQYVMNTNTKAWCRFTDWDAETFAVYNKELYFGSGTAVYKAWSGTLDNGSTIRYYAKQAFQDFGDGRPKLAKLFMPLLSVNDSITYATAIDVDFNNSEMGPGTNYPLFGSRTTVWDTAVWDTSTWDESVTDPSMFRIWGGPSVEKGRWLSGKIRVDSNAESGYWHGSTIIYEIGDGL